MLDRIIRELHLCIMFFGSVSNNYESNYLRHIYFSTIPLTSIANCSAKKYVRISYEETQDDLNHIGMSIDHRLPNEPR